VKEEAEAFEAQRDLRKPAEQCEHRSPKKRIFLNICESSYTSNNAGEPRQALYDLQQVHMNESYNYMHYLRTDLEPACLRMRSACMAAQTCSM